MGDLQRALTGLLNKFSVEGESNTPDFILAKFMLKCLEAFDEATTSRTSWHVTSKEEAATERDAELKRRRLIRDSFGARYEYEKAQSSGTQ